MLLAGCGGSGAPVARDQVAHVSWREAGNPHNLLGGPIEFRVSTIRIGPNGWSIGAGVVNRTKQPLRLVYSHQAPGHNAFGITIGTNGPPATATRFDPRVPVLMPPGTGWAGTFSGPDRLAPGDLVHVQFGQFGTLHADRFTWVTDHAYKVR